MNLKDELLNVIDALDSAGIEYAICGGFAVIIHGYPRTTQDIDLMIEESSLEHALQIMEPMGFILNAGFLPFDVGKPTQRRIYRASRAVDNQLVTVDFIFVSTFLESVWEDREMIDTGDRHLVVVSKAGLKKMKQAAGRHRDLDDLQKLGLADS